MKEEAVEQIAKVLQTTPDKLKTFIESGEAEGFVIPELMVKTDVDTLVENTKKERFDEGKKAALEMFTKHELKAKYPDIKYDGKDAFEFIKRISAFEVEKAGIEPNEQITTLQQDKTELQKQIEGLQGTIKEKENSFNTQMFQLEVNKDVEKFIPGETVIPKSSILQLFNLKYGVSKNEEGKIEIREGDQLLKDDLKNLRTIEDVTKSFIDENKFLKKDGFQGSGTPDFTGKFETMSQYQKYCESNNLDPQELKNIEYLNKNKAENFDLAK
jgi:hypothetical protein